MTTRPKSVKVGHLFLQLYYRVLGFEKLRGLHTVLANSGVGEEWGEIGNIVATRVAREDRNAAHLMHRFLLPGFWVGIITTVVARDGFVHFHFSLTYLCYSLPLLYLHENPCYNGDE